MCWGQKFWTSAYRLTPYSRKNAHYCCGGADFAASLQQVEYKPNRRGLSLAQTDPLSDKLTRQDCHLHTNYFFYECKAEIFVQCEADFHCVFRKLFCTIECTSSTLCYIQNYAAAISAKIERQITQKIKSIAQKIRVKFLPICHLATVCNVLWRSFTCGQINVIFRSEARVHWSKIQIFVQKLRRQKF